MARVSVYIDNSNVFKNIKAIKNTSGDKNWVQLYNPLKLAEKLAGKNELVSVYFYCVPPPPWLLTEGEDSKNKHAIASRYYAAVGKLPKVQVRYGYLQGNKGNPHEKNIDTQLGTDMVTHAALGQYDTAVLVSNDGDYTSAIENTKRLGKRVELLFFKGYLAGSLKKNCDLTRRARRSFFELLDFYSK